MAWSLYRWVWQLQSPLHVGMSPAGSLNRTRLYIPARTLWGALTAEYARNRDSTAPDYDRAIVELRENMRFSYLFPAEPGPESSWLAWLPRYEWARGLVWVREDKQARSHREMRLQLVITRASTAINPQTNAIAEGTLRETECLSPRWKGGEPVALIGYVFSRGHGLLRIPDLVGEIFVGGDARYGLGRMTLVRVDEAGTVFACEVELDGEHPRLKSDWILAHGTISESAVDMRGEQEALLGWDYGTGPWKPGLFWVPGTSVIGRRASWHVAGDGLWHYNGECDT